MKYKAVPAITIAAVVLGAVLMPALPASAAATGTITVQLQRPSGSKLSLGNVAVTATSAASSVVKKTNSHGRVTFRLPAKAIETITAAKSGYLTGTHGKLKVLAGKTLHPRVTLAKGASATGTLTKATGGALAGSVVSLFTKAGKFVASTKTDAKGVYKFTGLKTGSYIPQFNSRTIYDSANSAITGFTTTYWKGTDWASAHVLALRNQSAKKAATVAKKLNVAVPVGHSLTGGLSILDLGSAGQVGLQGVNDATSITGPLTELGSGFTLRIPAGSYKVWISNGLTGSNARKIWFTGAAIIPSFNESDAATIEFTGDADENITMQLLTSILTNPGDMLPGLPTIPGLPTDPSDPGIPGLPGLPTLPTLPGLPTIPGIGESGSAGDSGASAGVDVSVTVTTPSVTTPDVTTPSVTTPSVTTPSITTPVGTVPSITVPSITVPSITVPPVTIG